MFCALFVFYFHYYVSVLRTNCFQLSLLRWCFAHYLFFNIHYYVGIFLLFLLLRWCFFLLSLLRFLLSLLRWVFCAVFVFYFYYYVGVLRTICFLLLLLRWCVAYHLFSTFANTLMFCALFVFYFKYYVGVLRTICFLL